MSEKQLLTAGAMQLGLPLDEALCEQFQRYLQLLTLWGKKMNLTAVQEPRQVVVRHFLDSLALVRRLPSATELPTASLVDIGSGAGLPGAICALLRPDLQVTLVERIGKKAAFLMTLRRELGLRYEVVADDASKLSQQFGIAVSRAALPLPEWLQLGRQLVLPGGMVLVMTSLAEVIPPPPLDCRLVLDENYDVGAGPYRLLGYRAQAH